MIDGFRASANLHSNKVNLIFKSRYKTVGEDGNLIFKVIEIVYLLRFSNLLPFFCPFHFVALSKKIVKIYRFYWLNLNFSAFDVCAISANAMQRYTRQMKIITVDKI